MTDPAPSNLEAEFRANRDRFQRLPERSSSTDIRVPAIESAELSNQDNHGSGFRYHPPEDDHRATNVAFCIMLRVIIASASGVAIYSVCSGKAALLMPLYSMVLIDFFLGLPAFYNRDIDPTYADGLSDFRNDPIPPHNDRLIHTFFLISSLILMSKIYFLSVIWQCFRYLRLKELIAPYGHHHNYHHHHSHLHQYQQHASRVPISRQMYEQMPDHRSLGLVIDEPNGGARSSLAPPAYDAVTPTIKPPSYEDAIKCSSIFTIDMQAPHASSPPPPPPPPHEQVPDYTPPPPRAPTAADSSTQQSTSSINHLA